VHEENRTDGVVVKLEESRISNDRHGSTSSESDKSGILGGGYEHTENFVNSPASSAVPRNARCIIIDVDDDFSLSLNGIGMGKSRMVWSRSRISRYSCPGLQIASRTGTRHC